MNFEVKIITFLQAGASEGWTAFFEIFSLLGSWIGLIILFFLFYQLQKTYAYTFLLTYGIGVGFNYVLKLIISRDRPFITYDSIKPLTDAFGGSMPSGHAVSSAIIAVFVCFLAFKLAKKKFTKIATTISMMMFVLIVCLSRMYFGVHYLTDIILGLAFGAIFALIGLGIYNKLLRRAVKGDY